MNRLHSRSVAHVVAGAAAILVASPAFSQSVVPLPAGAIPGGISRDGGVVVGTFFEGEAIHPFRFANGTLTLLDERAPVEGAFATRVSPNGLHVAGMDADSLGICGLSVPVRFFTAAAWLGSDTALTPIGTLPGDNASTAAGVADTGAVAGTSSFRTGDSRLCLSTYRAYRWSPDGGFTELISPDPDWQMVATGISADSGTITGYAQTPRGDRGFMWTKATGVQALPPLQGGGDTLSRAEDLSDGAEAIVGSTAGRASIWEGGGDAALLRMAEGVDEPHVSVGDRISGDASVVTGTMTYWVQGSPPQLVTRLFIWDRVRGVRPLLTALTDEFGVDLTGVFISEITDLSRTGRYLVADGAIDGMQRGLLIDLGRRAACIADVTRDGVINSADFFAYLGLFFDGASESDINEDGVVSSEDFFAFLDAFFADC